MEDREDNFFQLSAIQHYLFCPRQCFLIHAEQVWLDNIFTAEGKVMHENADNQRESSRGTDVKIEYGLLMRSVKLGISGKADVVEFHRQTDETWLPYPVEYKRGKPKSNICDRAQLCAQAICLEEMLKLNIPEGALFYGKTKHRQKVVFDKELRLATEETCAEIHKLLSQKKAPPAIYEKEKCENCSIIEACLPKIPGKNVAAYLSSLLSSTSSESSTSSKNGVFP